VPLDQFSDRKALARYAEEKIRNDVVELLRGRPAIASRPRQDGATSRVEA